MQGLIIAIIIITFLYNVYKNFKKEMEKAKIRGQEVEAKQRAEAVERKQKTVYKPVVAQPYQTAYDEAVSQEYTPQPALENNMQDYLKEKAKAKQEREAKAKRCWA